MFFKIFLLVFSFTYVSSEVTQPPEIIVKFFMNNNGDHYHVTYPSDSLHIEKRLHGGPVEISCIADYPITWNYVIEDKPVTLGDMVEYKREGINSTNVLVENEMNGKFVAKFTLWKLFESQSGQYICQNFKTSSQNTSINLFVSGERTFNTISKRVVLLDKTVSNPVGIYCPVTNPKLEVTLYKQTSDKTELELSKDSDVEHVPVFGFRFRNNKSREDILGTYVCRTKTNNVVENVIVVFTDDVNEVSKPPIACRDLVELASYLRSTWLESRCKDINAFAYFRNENGSSPWRKGSSEIFALPQTIPKGILANQNGRNLSDCEDDWSLMEYAKNFKPTKDICFTEKDLGTPPLKVFGETFNSEPENQTYTILNVTYNGHWDGAGGKFVLAFSRSRNLSQSEYLAIGNFTI
ncbi:unnamed protein product [Orchesella dallaii]|uniref:Ig-like domain-containing protein n=1 Tax=Orchesella dallaii TaxID=48710 RepID=A0ABP1RQT6_9HEXA